MPTTSLPAEIDMTERTYCCSFGAAAIARYPNGDTSRSQGARGGGNRGTGWGAMCRGLRDQRGGQNWFVSVAHGEKETSLLLLLLMEIFKTGQWSEDTDGLLPTVAKCLTCPRDCPIARPRSWAGGSFPLCMAPGSTGTGRHACGSALGSPSPPNTTPWTSQIPNNRMSSSRIGCDRTVRASTRS
jgi:hypothetical protein